MPPAKRVRNGLLLFCSGLVLGSAFMASPALGFVLAAASAVYIAMNLTRGAP